jgi:predicted nucleic acid-binding protein
LRFLLDTNVISELSRETPHASVLRWKSQYGPADFALSVLTVTEVRAGIEMLPDGRRKEKYQQWFAAEILEAFEDFLLPVNIEVADLAGRFTAQMQRHGLSPDTADMIIAATAATHNLTLATRNLRHFLHLNVDTVNPFE